MYMSKSVRKHQTLCGAKHRPWGYDDMFAEYMCLVNDMCIEKWDEMYEINK